MHIHVYCKCGIIRSYGIDFIQISLISFTQKFTSQRVMKQIYFLIHWNKNNNSACEHGEGPKERVSLQIYSKKFNDSLVCNVRASTLISRKTKVHELVLIISFICKCCGILCMHLTHMLVTIRLNTKPLLTNRTLIWLLFSVCSVVPCKIIFVMKVFRTNFTSVC